MAKKDSKITPALMATGIILAGAVIAVAVNVILGAAYQRVDLTEEKLFTLSDATRNVLKNLDSEVTINFYYSKDAAQLPAQIKTYAGRVEDLLHEYEVAAGGKIKLVKINPTPDSDEEDNANMNGVIGQPMGMTGDMLYLGVSINFLDENVAIPFLHPNRENMLEYDLTSAILQVINPKKKVVGIMSPLPVMGEQPEQNQMMMGMPPQGGTDPWWCVQELKKQFEVKEVATDAEFIGDVDVLILVHPHGLSDKSLYAVDQFLMKGGKLMVFLDPSSLSEAEAMQQQQQNPMMRMQLNGSELAKLLDAWGIEFENDKVVCDIQYKTTVGGGGRRSILPSVLTLTSDAFSEEDPVIGQIDNVLQVFAGSIDGDGAEGLTKDVLIQSSKKAFKADRFQAQMGMEAMGQQIKDADMQQYNLAVRLTGKFKTAFPDGEPKEEDKDEDQKEEKPADSLKESEETAVFVFGDSDMLTDQFCVRIQQFLNQRIAMPVSDNLNLLVNAVDQLQGDVSLISIRSRGKQSRPLKAIEEMEAEADQKSQAKIADLEEDLRKTQQKLNEMQRSKDDNQKQFLSQEQKDTLEEFYKKRAETREELKRLRRDARKDVESFKNKLKFVNIALMPILVVLAGIIVYTVKLSRKGN